MDLRAAGALLALAACLASAAAAPTAGNQTALDVYDGPSEGCYYNFQHYGEGDRIMTNEPCLNCTCHNRMLMCYLRVCPFTKPIGQDCSVEKRADQCCPIVTCPDVPVDLLTSTSTSSPAEYGDTGIGKLDRYGCSINGKYFSEGSKVPSTPNKPCEHCYCIRNMTTCVMQECTLHVDGCTPIYHKDVCCPVRYSCDHPEDEIPLLDDMTTTVRPTPGFLLTTTTLSPVTQMTQDCVHDDQIFADGALIKTEKACQHCYCMKGDIVCVVQECGTPMENEGKNCTSMPPREGQCCPDTYICESDEVATEAKTDFTTTPSLDQVPTLTPPRRVNVEGSGYRNEPDEPFTELPTFEPDTEGSGEESFKPIDAGEMLIPEKETISPLITTKQDDNIDMVTPSTSKIPIMDVDISEKVTTEPDKGENTVPSGDLDEHSTEVSITDHNITPEDDTSANKLVPTTESYFDEKSTAVHEDDSSSQDTKTTESDVLPTTPGIISETTVVDQSPPLVDKSVTADNEPTEITESTPSKEHETTVSQSTTLRESEKLTTEVTTMDILTTESSTAFIEQAAKTTTVQLPEEENEVLMKEPTTESSKPDGEQSETDSPSSKQPEVVTELSTSSEDRVDTTPINPVDNEIDEEPIPTSPPGRIPGEGDCLIDGVTYSNETTVPSSNNCHSSCRCISSIVKCDPIICSAPPDYMDNCQPMYDTPEACCPTYVCDHTKETVPPQSHSQMSGTESPVPTPNIECDGDQCVVKNKDEPSQPVKPCTSEGCSDDSSSKPDDCGNQGCQGTDKKGTDLQPHPPGPSEECIGNKCTSLQEQCKDGNCELPITKDQNCDSESGCKIPAEHPCQGDDCKSQSEVSPDNDRPISCNSPDECKDSKVPESAIVGCEGTSCLSQPPSPVAPDEKEKCKDGSDCYTPTQTVPATGECNEESCVQKPVSDSSEPVIGECDGSECISQDTIPQITEAPESSGSSEHAPKVTEIPTSHDTKPDENITDITIDKEETGKTTQLVPEEPESTTQYSEKEGQKKDETLPFVTMISELETQTPKEVQYDSPTETTIQEETTIAPLVDMHKDLESTPMPVEEYSTQKVQLPESITDNRATEYPDIKETMMPEIVSEPIDQFDTFVTTARTDTISDEEKYDLTTPQPTAYIDRDMSMEITTESQNKQTDLNVQSITTESPQLEPERGESHTDLPRVGETGEPVSIVTERLETDTTVKDQKVQEEVSATSSYGTENTSEGNLDVTNVPLTTVSPIEDEEKYVPSTSKPDDIISVPETTTPLAINKEPGKIETESPVIDITDTTSKPEIYGISSQAPELVDKVPEQHVTELEESTTNIYDIPQKVEVHSVVTSPKNVEPNIFETETPMSIVTEKEVEIKPTESSPTDIHDIDELSTKYPESPIPHSTESYTPETEQSSEKPEDEEKDSENMPSLNDEKHTDLVTEKATEGSKIETTSMVLKEEIPTEPPTQESGDESKVTVFEPITEATPVSVSSVEEVSDVGHEGPSVTEATIQQTTGAPHKEVSEIEPEPVTEIPTHEISEPVDIVTPTKDESGGKTNDVTEIPELTIHEHTDSIFTTIEPGITEKVTKVPDTFTTVPQEDVSAEKVTPKLQDSTTSIPELPLQVTQDEENVTSKPDYQQTEINEFKPQDVTNEILGQSSTESQKVSTEAPESQDGQTNIPEMSITEKVRDFTQESDQDNFTTNAPKVSATEPTKAETHIQDTNVPVITVTEKVRESTESSESQDVSTTASEDIGAKVPEIFEDDSRKETSKVPETTDASISDITTSELDKDVTSIPEMHDADTKIHVIPETETELQKETTMISQDTTTKTPLLSVTETYDGITETSDSNDAASYITSGEPQEETSEAPKKPDITTDVTKISPTEPQREITEVPDDVVTQIPELHITEKATEAQMEVTETSRTQESTEATETQKETSEAPVIHDYVPEIPVTDTEKERPDVSDTAYYIPGMTTTESQKDVSESSNPQDDAHVTGTDSPMGVTAELEETNTHPYLETTEAHGADAQKDITEPPEAQATSVPKISDLESPQKEAEKPDVLKLSTNIPELSDKETNVVTEIPDSQNIVTNAPDSSVTDQQKEVTNPISELPEITTVALDLFATEPHKTVTETPVQEIVTKPAERTQTEADEFETKPEESTVTQKESIITDSPLKITTKPDEYTETEISETDMQTESPIPEQSPILPTDGDSSYKQTTKVPESLVTEPVHKLTESDFVTTELIPSKSGEDESKEIVTESPIAEPTMKPEHIEPEKPEIVTELPISQIPVEFNTQSSHFDDTDRDVSTTPEVYVTEKQVDTTVTPENTRTDATSQSPEHEDNITEIYSEEPESTPEIKHEMPETTPYLVLLEEHTHKKDITEITPEDEITTISSALPLDYEPSTSESPEKITESVPITETKMPSQEETMVTDKDQSIQEPEKITEHSLVSDESTTVASSLAIGNNEEAQGTEKPPEIESNEISTSSTASAEEQSETEIPVTPDSTSDTSQDISAATEKQQDTSAPEEEFILATTKATTIITEEDVTTPSPSVDKIGKPEEEPKPAHEDERPKPDTFEAIPKPGSNEIQPTEELPQPDDESHFPPSGTSSYGQEPADYGEEDQAFGPGTCRYGGKVYVSAQQIPRDDPCDFCFCFRSDIICLQQSCPPPIHGCHEEPIQGFCCPRYECPVSMATSVNVTTTTTTTTTTLPPHFLPHAYPGLVQKRGCQIKGHTYKVGEVVRASSGPCLHCTCGGDGQMKCDPKVCTPEPMLRQMIAAAVSAKRRR